MTKHFEGAITSMLHVYLKLSFIAAQLVPQLSITYDWLRLYLLFMHCMCTYPLEQNLDKLDQNMSNRLREMFLKALAPCGKKTLK